MPPKLVLAIDPLPADDVPRLSRRRLIGRAAVAGGALLAGGLVVGGLAEPAASAPSASQDAAILRFLLALEHVQVQFYERAAAEGSLEGELARFAQVALAHERSHADVLAAALGAQAPTAPTVSVDPSALGRGFGRSAVLLEEAVLGAYNAQAAGLRRPALARVVRIASVEARHTAWIRDVVGEAPAPVAADPGRATAAVRAQVRAAGIRTGS